MSSACTKRRGYLLSLGGRRKCAHPEHTSTGKTKGSTGVEMEALTSASVCALTVYDMCKAIDKGMIIGPTYLIEKTGGKNGDFHRASDI